MCVVNSKELRKQESWAPVGSDAQFLSGVTGGRNKLQLHDTVSSSHVTPPHNRGSGGPDDPPHPCNRVRNLKVNEGSTVAYRCVIP